MSEAHWRCTACKRDWTPADGSPLEETLTAKFRRAKCAGPKCKRAYRLFEPSGDNERNLRGGRILGDRAMGRAERSAIPEGWTARFDAALAVMAARREEFTSEDITARVGFPAQSTSNAIGARMNAAAKRGLIVWTGRMQPAARARRHANLVKVWKGA